MEEVLSQRSSLDPPGGTFLSLGSRPLGWDKALATVVAPLSLKNVAPFGSLGVFFSGRGGGENHDIFFLGKCGLWEYVNC